MTLQSLPQPINKKKNKKRFLSIFLALTLLLVGMSFVASSTFAQTTQSHVYLSLGGVSVVNTDTKVTEDYIAANNALFMAVTPDNSRLYIIENGNSTVTVYDTVTNSLVDTIVMGVWPDPQIIDIEITPNGQFAYVSERWSGEVAVIDTSTNTVVDSVDTGNYAYGIDITPNGDYVYVTNEYDDTVSVIATATNTVVSTISSPDLDSPTEVAITPNGAYAYVVNFNAGVAVIDTSSNTVVANVTAGTSPHGVDVTPNGDFVYVSNYFSNDVTVIETAGNSVVTTIATTTGGTWLREVEITPDGQFAYVAVQTTYATEIIDIATNTVVDTLSGGFGIAFANLGGAPDSDGDGVTDGDDNCSVANPGQEDSNSDGQGDACDPIVVSLESAIDPVDINAQPVSAAATFSDADDGDAHTASFDWGDGNSSAGTVDQGANSASASHTYADPGVYTVSVIISDAFGAEATGTYEYVVIYDPTAGFVTGAGRFDSPAGAYTADPLWSGEAKFGMISRYMRNKTTPDGNAQFQITAQGFNFQSTSLEWLVVNRSALTAIFTGHGTINGTGNYEFTVWSTDGGYGGSNDSFRIQILERDHYGNETIIYDNGTEAGVTTGNITVHP